MYRRHEREKVRCESSGRHALIRASFDSSRSCAAYARVFCVYIYDDALARGRSCSVLCGWIIHLRDVYGYDFRCFGWLGFLLIVDLILKNKRDKWYFSFNGFIAGLDENNPTWILASKRISPRKSHENYPPSAFATKRIPSTKVPRKLFHINVRHVKNLTYINAAKTIPLKKVSAKTISHRYSPQK